MAVLHCKTIPVDGLLSITLFADIQPRLACRCRRPNGETSGPLLRRSEVNFKPSQCTLPYSATDVNGHWKGDGGPFRVAVWSTAADRRRTCRPVGSPPFTRALLLFELGHPCFEPRHAFYEPGYMFFESRDSLAQAGESRRSSTFELNTATPAAMVVYTAPASGTYAGLRRRPHLKVDELRTGQIDQRRRSVPGGGSAADRCAVRRSCPLGRALQDPLDGDSSKKGMTASCFRIQSW